jgi:hypothetical protein
MGKAPLLDLVRIVGDYRRGRKGARGAAREAHSKYGHLDPVMSRAEVNSDEDLLVVGNVSVGSSEAEWG